MKLTITLLLFAAVNQAASVNDFKTKQKIQSTERAEKTEKRELAEGNNGVEKRAPLLPAVSSTPTSAGVEYADSKENLQDKSPTQQIYATPVPQIAKISDVLSGQGPQFQAAIASHLYSPISVYQQRLGSPTTYEVSAPVPSQLAYTEHRLSVPSPALQYAPKPQTLSKPIIANYEPQAYASPYEQNLVQVQPIYQQPNHYQQIQYSQPQFYNQHLQYIQDQPAQQGGIVYAPQEQTVQYQKQTEQGELKNQPATSQIIEKQQIVQQDYNDKQQNALSYARFTFNQAAPSEQPHVQETVSPSPQPIAQQETHQQLLQPSPQPYAVQAQPIAQINYQLQHPSQHQNQHLSQLQFKTQQLQQLKPHVQQQQQIQYQAHQEAQQQQVQYQGHQYQQQPQLQYQQPQIQYQEPHPQYLYQQQLQHVQPLSNFHLQAQPQYQIQPQHYQLPQIQPQLVNVEKQEQLLSKQSFPQKQLIYKQPFQQQLVQPQHISHAQDLSYKNIPVLPTFPPVQYFGKFAHSIFSNYQH